MKRILLVLMVCVLISGCSGVTMAPPYRQETELMNNRLQELDKRCQAGDPNACRIASRIAAVHVERIVDAMHGRESD